MAIGTGRPPRPTGIPQRLIRDLERFIAGNNLAKMTFTKEQMGDLFSLILLSHGGEDRADDPGVGLLLAAFASRAGVSKGMAEAEARAAIRAYVQLNPPPAVMIEKVVEVVGDVVEHGGLDPEAAFAKFAAAPEAVDWSDPAFPSGPLVVCVLNPGESLQ